MSKMDAFEKEIEQAVNRVSVERHAGDTPDFIVAKFIRECFEAFGDAVRAREAWYGPRTDGSAKSADAVGQPTDNHTFPRA